MKTPKRLKKYRTDAGLTIYTLADRLAKEMGKSVNYSSVSYWENGEKFPRQKTLRALEDMFGVGYRDLFDDLTPEEIEELENRSVKEEH
ncbi:helix-turn-helix protein [Bacillus phage vB_BmeM-Goe8]|uniref:Helix-turn-helix protein n=1 Tax=Bacillus phage vB_BmeM-Goe8 TaxID=2593638 RepID=A0A516KMM4_9CAUD|nr:helix-turn-helix protein [Bacillus phage vB_BmeM-Goe8]QDP42842.1 helix-turn-helix protein [Bacillus phage vB_BmeM-Goe8]